MDVCLRLKYCVALTVVLSVSRLLVAQPAAPPMHATPEAIYRDISAMPLDARRVEFRALSPAMRDAVWTVHLGDYLLNHPDLTDDERSVILEAIGLLQTGLARVDRDEVDWTFRVYRPFLALQSRAEGICRHEVIREAFGVLGPAAPIITPAPGARSIGNVATNVGPSWGDCTCSQAHDFCGSPTSPVYCEGLPCTRSDIGCGWLWLQECTGICF